MNTKDQVLGLIKTLPENTTIDDIMEELYFKSQVDEGLSQLDTGKTVSHSIVKNRLKKWIKK